MTAAPATCEKGKENGEIELLIENKPLEPTRNFLALKNGTVKRHE